MGDAEPPFEQGLRAEGAKDRRNSSAGLAPRMRLKLGTGETFVIDITREPKLRAIRPSDLRSSSP